MGRASIDLVVGQEYGMLTVVGFGKQNNRRYWLCRCVCGSIVRHHSYTLRSGSVKSCGCKKKSHLISITRTHGLVGTREYRAWENMKSRCMNKSAPYYKHYGGRGITVCSKWSDSFEAFLADMGNSPGKGYSLDRIDNNGNYEPGNCRWATQKQQLRNMRVNPVITVDGVTRTVVEWSEISGVHRKTIMARIKIGRSEKDAIFTKAIYPKNVKRSRCKGGS